MSGNKIPDCTYHTIKISSWTQKVLPKGTKRITLQSLSTIQTILIPTISMRMHLVDSIFTSLISKLSKKYNWESTTLNTNIWQCSMVWILKVLVKTRHANHTKTKWLGSSRGTDVSILIRFGSITNAKVVRRRWRAVQ